MSNLPYIIILTSTECGACRNLHVTGNFSRLNMPLSNKDFAGFRWNCDKFWKLITANQNAVVKSPTKYKVMEFEFFNMKTPTIQGIKSFTIFTYETSEEDGEIVGDVHRDIYDRIEEGKDEYIYTRDGGEEIKDQEEEGSFNDFLARKFPRGLSLYTVQFPSFIYMSHNEFNKALDIKNNPNYSPYALSFGLVTGMKDNLWRPVRKDEKKEPWKNGLITFAEHIIKNPDLLTPPEVTIEVDVKDTKDKVKSVTIGTTSNPSTIVKGKSILKNTSIDKVKNSDTTFKIKFTPLNNKKSFNS